MYKQQPKLVQIASVRIMTTGACCHHCNRQLCKLNDFRTPTKVVNDATSSSHLHQASHTNAQVTVQSTLQHPKPEPSNKRGEQGRPATAAPHAASFPQCCCGGHWSAVGGAQTRSSTWHVTPSASAQSPPAVAANLAPSTRLIRQQHPCLKPRIIAQCTLYQAGIQLHGRQGRKHFPSCLTRS